jgi:hypothetical protein
MCYEGVYWINLAQNKVQWSVFMNTIHEHSGFIKGGEFINQLND